MTVFVTDGDQRASLAIVRSLGRRGASVVVGAEGRTSLASASRHCARHVTYPSPYADRRGFADWLVAFVASERIDAVLPVTDVTTHAICANAAALRRWTALAVPELAAFEFVSHKGHLVEWARRCDVRIPRTVVVECAAALPHALDRIEYPAVVKPVRSRYLTPAGWQRAGVQYAKNRDDLLQMYGNEPCLQSEPSLIQQRILGPGVGVFLLFDRGRRVAEFAHRRLRETPPSGGVSVLRESIALDPALRRAATRLLGRLAWHGVAMIEFKEEARTGEPFLMEVNGRFWGSLQLAVDSGIDFPWLVCQLALGRVAPERPGYRVGVRSRWLLGDLNHLLLRLFKNPGALDLPPSAPTRWQVMKDFVACSGPDLHDEVIRAGDWRPALHEIRQTVGGLGASARDRLKPRAALAALPSEQSHA